MAPVSYPVTGFVISSVDPCGCDFGITLSLCSRNCVYKRMFSETLNIEWLHCQILHWSFVLYLSSSSVPTCSVVDVYSLRSRVAAVTIVFLNEVVYGANMFL